MRVQSPCPQEAHILVRERDGELTTLGRAVKKNNHQGKAVLDKMIWNCLLVEAMPEQRPERSM